MRRLRFRKRARRVMRHMSGGLQEPSSFVTRAQVRNILTPVGQNRQSVCFTGHRYLPTSDIQQLSRRLDILLALCYRRGYRDFFCGGALGFDMLAADRVAALRREHADVRLILVIPCSDQMRCWSEQDTAHYERMLYAADDIRVLSPFYYEGCMQVRNRYMVDHSSLCICYLRHGKGGTASTVAYAVKEQIHVLNAAMEDVCAAFPVG